MEVSGRREEGRASNVLEWKKAAVVRTLIVRFNLH
jgi:hypothetical protein